MRAVVVLELDLGDDPPVHAFDATLDVLRAHHGDFSEAGVVRTHLAIKETADSIVGLIQP